MIEKLKKLLKITHTNYEQIIILVILLFCYDHILDENDHTIELLYNTLNDKHEHSDIYVDNLLYSFEKCIKSKKYSENDKEKIILLYEKINHILLSYNITFEIPIKI